MYHEAMKINSSDVIRRELEHEKQQCDTYEEAHRKEGIQRGKLESAKLERDFLRSSPTKDKIDMRVRVLTSDRNRFVEKRDATPNHDWYCFPVQCFFKIVSSNGW
jgi:hypothetical protein